MPGLERRKFPRLSFNVNVEYKLLLKPESQNLFTKSMNISAGGICIISLEKINVGSTVEMKFFLPDSEKNITAIGRVVWIEEFIVGDARTGKAYDAGIEFIKIDEKERDKVKEYVMRHL